MANAFRRQFIAKSLRLDPNGGIRVAKWSRFCPRARTASQHRLWAPRPMHPKGRLQRAEPPFSSCQNYLGIADPYIRETLGTSAACARLARMNHTRGDNRIVAVGLLTQTDLDVLGSTFTRIWPVEETPCFSELLRAIDEADREIRHSTQSAQELA